MRWIYRKIWHSRLGDVYRISSSVTLAQGIEFSGSWLRLRVDLSFLILVFNWVNRGTDIDDRKDASILLLIVVKIHGLEWAQFFALKVPIHSLDRFLLIFGLDIPMFLGD